MSDCVFCKIVEGDIPSTSVYRDDAVYIFMDINPLNTGHTLVIPVAHAADLSELDPATGGKIFEAGMKVADSLIKSDIRCEGVNFHLANGKAAGQEVDHVHLHVLPRFEGDGLGLKHPEGYPVQASSEELEDAANAIKANLD
jgi:diadenosine tetraphosphate (Ap4A) HIT family hydrolase